MVMITLYAREQKRHKCVEQSFDWCPMLRIDFLSSVYVLKQIFDLFAFSSIQFSHSVMSDSLQPQACRASLSITNSRSSLKLMSIE